MNLYGLTGQSLELLKMIEDGDCTQEQLAGALEVINASIETKVENTLYVVENAKANRKPIVEMIERLQAKLKALDSNIEWLQNNLFNNLELMGVDSYKAGVFTVKKQLNKPSIVIEDEKLIPAKYQTVIPASFSISKNDIAKDIKLGVVVPGAKTVQTKRWSIK